MNKEDKTLTASQKSKKRKVHKTDKMGFKIRVAPDSDNAIARRIWKEAKTPDSPEEGHLWPG